MRPGLRAFADPGFYVYLVRRFAGTARQMVRDYVNRPTLPPHRLRIADSAMVDLGAVLGAEAGLDAADPARLDIGPGAWVEGGAELGLTPGARLSIGANTSIHRGCVILGDVRIGSSCIFSYNIYVAAGSHVVDARPPWLIKDQDEAFAASRPRETVWIDDDVWIGWGVFIKSGVRIGRGAVIGANAVVLADVEPYSFCAGAPARKLGERLAFSPPPGLDAMQDDTLPYFYAGFEHGRAALGQSRERGGIGLAGPAMLVLQGGSAAGAVRLRGRVTEGGEPVELMVSAGAGTPTLHRLTAGEFELRVALTGRDADAPVFLQPHALVRLDPRGDASRIVVRDAALVAAS